MRRCRDPAHPSKLARAAKPASMREQAARSASRLLRKLARVAPRASERAAAFALRDIDYATWIERRVRWRRDRYLVDGDENLFSLLTCVWNTPAAFLDELAASVFAQDFGGFEWVILDNGTTRKETLALLEEIEREPRVRLLRATRNLGIVGGLRRCLQAAAHPYVMAVDHDDRLYPDALRVFAWHIREHQEPALLYSDEDKVLGETLRDPYFKPPWDFVLFLNSCYIAHLGALDRKLALELDCYTDPEAEGSHDWDSFLRFVLAGHLPEHVPEVVYTWRMHLGSTALDIDSKSFIHSSQQRVLGKFLASHEHGAEYAIAMSPFVDQTPDWWFVRRSQSKRRVLEMKLRNETPLESLKSLADEADAEDAVVAISWQGVVPDGESWYEDALSILELHSETAVVTGRVIDKSERIVSAGEYFGYGGVCGCPDAGASTRSPGYHMQLWKQKRVDAPSPLLCVVEGHFLAQALEHLGAVARSPALLGGWLGAEAARLRRWVVYSPYVSGSGSPTRAEWDDPAREEELDALAATTRPLAERHGLLSPVLSRDPARPWLPEPLPE